MKIPKVIDKCLACDSKLIPDETELYCCNICNIKYDHIYSKFGQHIYFKTNNSKNYWDYMFTVGTSVVCNIHFNSVLILDNINDFNELFNKINKLEVFK